MIDRLIVNLSNAGMLTRKSLRAILIAYGDEDEIRFDLECMTDETDEKHRDVYDLVCRTAGVPLPRYPPRSIGISGDSTAATAAWDAWFGARRERFWRAVREVTGWKAPVKR